MENFFAQNFFEAVQLQTGASFGELALISNKTRAATIRCLENTHFAVLSKEGYEKVLGKIEHAKLNKLVDFLKSVPTFKHWSKSALLKLTYFFKKKSFIRNQVVYKEGDNSKFLYVIKEGEFEISKKMRPEKDSDLDLQMFLGPRRKEDKRSDKVENVLGKGDIYYPHKVLVLGKGNIFGEEDAVVSRLHTTSVRCISMEGELLCISLQDFNQRVKTNDESWQNIKRSAKQKELTVLNQITRTSKIEKHSKRISQKLCKKRNENHTIKNMDFFKVTFWGEPLPPRKMDRIINLNDSERKQRDAAKSFSLQTKTGFQDIWTGIARERGINDKSIIEAHITCYDDSPVKKSDTISSGNALFIKKNTQLPAREQYSRS